VWQGANPPFRVIRAKDAGYITAGVVGNMDARSYNQRTWCRYWSLTPKGAQLVDVPFDYESSGRTYSLAEAAR
jgi:hypothetical protein